jgi:hypothetical protein
MKIGIITFHCADNYGAVLQTFALYQKLKDLFSGSEIFIVDYRPASITKSYSLIKLESIRGFIFSVIHLPFSVKRKTAFNKFRKKYFALIDIKDIRKLDYLICGSDQIWNSNLTKGFDPYYFGGIEGFTGKIVTYAASDGGNIDSFDPDLLRSYLANIAVLSVREPEMLPFLKQYREDISVVLDPVFLYGTEYWQNFVTNRKHQDYILIYRMAVDDILLQDAYKLANMKGLQIIEIAYYFPLKKILKNRHKIILCASIPDFLSYIFYAKYVFTNSFHGLAFSIIFNKDFYVYKLKTKKQNRIHAVLSEFALTDRYSSSWFDSGELKNIDYYKVNNLIKQKVNESIYFLNNALCDSKFNKEIQK